MHWQHNHDISSPPIAPVLDHDSRPPHWTHPWKGQDRNDAKEGKLNQLFETTLRNQREEFAAGWEGRHEENGITLRRIQGHHLWQLYQRHAHKGALALNTRIMVANALALAANRTTTNKAHSAQSKSLRCLFGRRIQAILQDCQLYITKTQQPALQHDNLRLALLQPISVALQAQPIAALKLMDQVLYRCRPDIYRYKDNAGSTRDHLSPINLTLRTIVDSLNFEIACRPSHETLSQSIRSQPDFFQDTDMLNDLLDGKTNLVELKDPIQESLIWYIDSPHAFLLSHPAFRNARSLYLHCLSQAREPQDILDAIAQDRKPDDPGLTQACDLLLRSVMLHRTAEPALELYNDLWSRGVPISPVLLNELIHRSSPEVSSLFLEKALQLRHRAVVPRNIAARLSTKLLKTIVKSSAIQNRPDRMRAVIPELTRRKARNNQHFLSFANMQLHAARGDLKALHDELSQTHDLEARHADDCAPGKKPLTSSAFGLLLKACNSSDDVDLAEHFLTEALERRLKLRSSDFNLVIDVHVRKTNIDAALAIFEQMKEFGVLPDKYTFTTLIMVLRFVVILTRPLTLSVL